MEQHVYLKKEVISQVSPSQADLPFSQALQQTPTNGFECRNESFTDLCGKSGTQGVLLRHLANYYSFCIGTHRSVLIRRLTDAKAKAVCARDASRAE